MNIEDRELEEMRLYAGPFFTYALEARRLYILNRLNTEKEIRNLFIRTVDDIASEIRKSHFAGRFYSDSQSGNFFRDLLNKLRDGLIGIFDKKILLSVEAGTHQSKRITLHYLNKARIDVDPMITSYFRSNQIAVADVKSRTIKGLNLSDRIWEKSGQARQTIGSILESGIASGEDPIKIARALQDYVRDGANTLAVNYPNMVERFDGNMPMDLSYESLRLARTELAEAYGAGVIESAKISPSSTGVRWVLSPSHPIQDICDDYANHDEGLGTGVYRIENLPKFPAHPNCLCRLEPVHEDTDDFLAKLIEWNKNPVSQPDLENWYQTVYKTGQL